MLRDKIISVADKELNGKVSIGKIDGTILSSLFLRSTVVNIGQDTLLNAGLIELKISPLQIFLKRIYVRDLQISNTKIALVKYAGGELNISKLLNSSSHSKPAESSAVSASDSSAVNSHSTFPFIIEVAGLKLDNVNFSLQDSDKVNSTEYYNSINLHDLRIKDIKLSLSALADFAHKNFKIEINEFSFLPNLNNFNLKALSGEFSIDTAGIIVNNLKLITEGTNLSLTAKLDKFNLFNKASFSTLGNDNVEVNLNAGKFNFDDLSSIIPSTSILKGTASVNLLASGKINGINIKRLVVGFMNTHLEAEGKIENVLDLDDMYISTDFDNTVINQPDIYKILPSIGIPVFRNLGLVKFDTLNFRGNPKNFFAKTYLQTSKGSVYLKSSLDIRKKAMKYNVYLATKNLNLYPFTGVLTNLNLTGTIVGSGLSAKNLNTKIKFIANGSSVYGNKIDTLNLNADAGNKKIKYKLLLKSDTTAANLAGNFDFTNISSPAYNVKGFVRDINLAEFTKDPSLASDMNFSINGGGSNFDLDKLNLFLKLNLERSILKGVNIDSARAIVDIRSNDNGERVINIISDLADLTVIGKFSAKHTITILSKEAGWVADAVKAKIKKIIYPDSVFNNQAANSIAVLPAVNKNPIQPDSSSFKYSIEFKNFDLLSLLMGENLLSLNGSMDGSVKTDSLGISITSNTNLDYLKFWGNKKVFFLSNFKLGLNLSNNYYPSSLKDISANIELKADRIFSVSDFRNISLNLKLLRNNANVYFSGNLKDKAKAAIRGNVYLPGNAVRLNLDTLAVSYKDYNLVNKGKIKINYSRDQIKIDNFELAHNRGVININGLLNRTGTQDLKLNINNISGKDLSEALLNLTPGNSLNASVHLNAEITGNFSKPVMKINFGADSVTFKNKVFGSLESSLNYTSKNLLVNLMFLDSLKNNAKPALLISGNVPIDLSFTGGGDRFSKRHPVNLSLNASNFNLAALGNILPHVYFLGGDLNSNIKLTGLYTDLKPTGNIKITGIHFIPAANNMEYFAGLSLNIKDNKISIDNLLLANSPNTLNGGQIRGSGNIIMNDFKPVSINVSMGGTLKVLSEASKAVSPKLYGDLAISTDGDINFTRDANGYFLNAPLIIKEAKLTFSPSQSAFKNTTDNFIYRYIKSSAKKNKNELDFEKLIKLSRQNALQKSNGNIAIKIPFSYVVNIKVQNEAVLKFILSKEINQSLTAIISGNMQYENIGGNANSQGELTLLDGSTLNFIKTFDASGTIRFESQLTNPYLNIVATYQNYYTPPEPDSKEEQVAVKIKINGPLKDLSQSFLKDKNNISVYVGADNISNNKPDPSKDFSDAVLFIVTGKFSSSGLSADQQQTANQSGSFFGSVTNSAAASLAGSLLGGVLNRYLGDYVSGVEVRNVGSTTKFNLVGKVKNFRYSIGGTTGVFQDLNQANVSIEYPLLKNFLIRIERKEAIDQTNVTNDMINELGLKYRFEF